MWCCTDIITEGVCVCVVLTLLASEANLQASEAPSLVMKMEACDILYVYVRQGQRSTRLLMRGITWQPMQPVILQSRIS